MPICSRKWFFGHRICRKGTLPTQNVTPPSKLRETTAYTSPISNACSVDLILLFDSSDDIYTLPRWKLVYYCKKETDMCDEAVTILMTEKVIRIEKDRQEKRRHIDYEETIF
jgi:hypothetical protein